MMIIPTIASPAMALLAAWGVGLGIRNGSRSSSCRSHHRRVINSECPRESKIHRHKFGHNQRSVETKGSKDLSRTQRNRLNRKKKLVPGVGVEPLGGIDST